LVSQGVGNKPFFLQMRRFFVASLVVFLPCFLAGVSPFNRRFRAQHLLSLSWLLTYPVFYNITYHSTVVFFSYHFDMVVALYLFLGISALQLYLADAGKTSKHSTVLISLFQTSLMLVPLIQWIYFYIYGHCLSEMALVAFYQTNINESLEYLQRIGYVYPLTLILFLLASFWLFYRLNNANVVFFSSRLRPGERKFILVCAIASLLYVCTNALPQTGLIQCYRDVRDYFQAAELFSQEREERLAKLLVKPTTPCWSKPSTVIMVIGESASRTYMSAYYHMEHDTTPWMRRSAEDGASGTILFTHAYGIIHNTVKALEQALTNKNQYNNVEFNNAVSILDVAKKAGYHTYWFSNQGTVGSAETQITLVARTADKALWTIEKLGNPQYDAELLGYLKLVDPKQNNFIVLHLRGSHDDFSNRYPPEVTRWGTPGDGNRVLNYDNSLLYTDDVLQKVFLYAQENLNLQAFVYFSDHGQAPDRLRNPDIIDYDWLRIPLMIYVAPEYREIYPQTYKSMLANKDKYFTNDLMFDTMLGILQVDSNYYIPQNSLTERTYKWTPDTLRTLVGIQLSNDK